MAWTTPRTWVAGEVVTAAIMNQHVRDNLSDLDARVNVTPQIDDDIETVAANKTLVNTNDATVLMLDVTGAARDVWGVELPPREPYQVQLINISGNNAVLKHESGSEATPSKRFFLPGGADLTLTPGAGTTLLHVNPPIGTRWVSVTV